MVVIELQVDKINSNVGLIDIIPQDVMFEQYKSPRFLTTCGMYMIVYTNRVGLRWLG